MTDLRAVLTPINCTISVLMYVPLFARIWERRSTADFAISTQAAIVYLQASSLAVAALEYAWFLFAYYIVQLLLTTSLLVIIVRYRHGR